MRVALLVADFETVELARELALAIVGEGATPIDGPLFVAESKKCEIAVSSILKVFPRKIGYRSFVAGYSWVVARREIAQDIDDGHLAGERVALRFLVGDPSNDPFATPVSKGARRHGAQLSGMIVDRPVVSLAGESRNAAHDFTSRIEGGFDKDGYAFAWHFEEDRISTKFDLWFGCSSPKSVVESVSIQRSNLLFMKTLEFPQAEDAVAETLRALSAEAGFGAPEIFGAAPGRVNVIGEHIDYNGGLVLPAAIDRYVHIGLRRREDAKVRLVSAQAPGEVVEFEVSRDLKPEGKSWGNYVKGVVVGLLKAGFEVPGFEASVSSTVPVGGGLSSSAALEAVFAKTLLTVTGKADAMEDIDLARLCQQAEHDFAGVPCGLMDQAAVILCEEGKLLLLDCVDDSFQHAPFEDPDWSLLIINSCVSHELSDGGYAVRRDGCHAAARILGVETLREVDPSTLDETLRNPRFTEDMVRYVRHAVTEIARTQEAVQSLGNKDYARAGELLNASHASLRDDFRVSCPELDFIAELAQGETGVAGCRMTGGGFGGSAIALVRHDTVEALTKLIEEKYAERFGIQAKIFETRPMGGTCAWLA